MARNSRHMRRWLLMTLFGAMLVLAGVVGGGGGGLLADDWKRDHLVGEDLICRYERGRELAEIIAADLVHLIRSPLFRDGVPEGADLIISQSWFRAADRSHLSDALLYAQLLGMRPFCETSLNDYNEMTANLMLAMDGAQFERDRREAIDATVPLIRALGEHSEYIRRASVAGARDTDVAVSFPVDGSVSAVTVAVRYDNARVQCAVYAADGTRVEPKLRTAGAAVFVIEQPAPGNWRVSVRGDGRTAVDVAATSDAAARYAAPLVTPANAPVVVGVSVPDDVREAHVQALAGRFNGLRLVYESPTTLMDDGTNGDPEAEDGVYAAAVNLPAGRHPLLVIVEGKDDEGRPYRRELRRMLVVGDISPVIYAGLPRAEISGPTGISANVLHLGELTADRLEVLLDSAPVQATFEAGEAAGSFMVSRLTIAFPERCQEGEHVVAITPAGESRSFYRWSFTRTLPRAEQIRLSEVSLMRQNCWVELRCVNGPVDIAGYKISDLDGSDKAIAAGLHLTLQTDQYAVAYWKRPGRTETDEVGDVNHNGIREIYLPGEPPATRGDQLAILGGTAIIDAVAWTDNVDTINENEFADNTRLRATGEWSGDTLILGLEQEPIGRINDEDNNRSNDWAVYTASTPGRANTTPHLPPPTDAPGRSAAANAAPGGSGPNTDGWIQSGAVLINEVNPREEKIEWAELYCARGPVDISACVLTDLEGEDQRLAAEAVTLREGEYAVVHWGRGADETDRAGDLNGNGVRDLFVADDPPTSTDDNLVLRHGERRVDVICWTNNDGKLADSELGDLQMLLREGDWQADGAAGETACVRAGNSEQSLGRLSGRQDRNRPDDWVKVVNPTPGRANRALVLPPRGSLMISEVNPAARRGDTARILCVKGTVEISSFVMTDLDGQDEVLAREPVTLAEGKSALVHWGQGRDETDRAGDLNGNGEIDLYVNDQDLAGPDDQLALVLDDQIYDAVVWSSQDGAMPEGEFIDLKKLVARGEWRCQITTREDQTGARHLPATSQGLRRRNAQADNNTPDDWE